MSFQLSHPLLTKVFDLIYQDSYNTTNFDWESNPLSIYQP